MAARDRGRWSLARPWQCAAVEFMLRKLDALHLKRISRPTDAMQGHIHRLRIRFGERSDEDERVLLRIGRAENPIVAHQHALTRTKSPLRRVALRHLQALPVEGFLDRLVN